MKRNHQPKGSFCFTLLLFSTLMPYTLCTRLHYLVFVIFFLLFSSVQCMYEVELVFIESFQANINQFIELHLAGFNYKIPILCIHDIEPIPSMFFLVVVGFFHSFFVSTKKLFNGQWMAVGIV